ncbi:MAG: AraC family transcriptional regulator [Solobacterium sp.]|nr:AraC family transcriptional regulator [Solobacterium sp.]
MFEKYPMNHYEFSNSADGIDKYTEKMQEIPDQENLAPILDADYRLRGYADVLQFFPVPDDAFRQRLHLQSFSHMYSLQDYYTSRSGAATFLILHTDHGSGILECSGRTFHLEEGDLFWIDCRIPHTYRTDGTFWEHTDIHIGGTGAKDLYGEFAAAGQFVLRRNDIPYYMSDTEDLLDAYVRPESHRTMRIAHCIETFLMHLILSADKSRGRQAESSDILQNLIYYMHEHFREPLSMDQLSALSGLSRFHMSREFKKLTGFAPNEYLIRLRIEQSKVLLVSSSLPVYEIAALSGFESETYFSRLFHQRMHMTPGVYRKTHSGGGYSADRRNEVQNGH